MLNIVKLLITVDDLTKEEFTNASYLRLGLYDFSNGSIHMFKPIKVCAPVRTVRF